MVEIIIKSGGKNDIPTSYNTTITMDGKPVKDISFITFHVNTKDVIAKWSVGMNEKKSIKEKIKALFQ